MALEAIPVEELSPLCVRINNAFSVRDISTIHETYNKAVEPIIEVMPNCKIQVEFDKNFIDCINLGHFQIYNDKEDEKTNNPLDDDDDLIQVRICESSYSLKHRISNITCYVTRDRLNRTDLNKNYSKILCKTEHRNFGVLYSGTSNKEQNDEINGHTVTYLDAMFHRYASNVYAKMMNYCKFINKKMKWDLLSDDSYRTKCIEYIQYKEKGDNLGWHCDMGSLVTMVIMLSKSNEYKGGNFQCKKLQKINDDKYIEKEAQSVPLESGDCVIFAADKCNHRVTDLIDGRRVVMCMELIYW